MYRLLFITCLAIHVSVTTCCVSSMTNGCSIPMNSSFPYKTVFHPACQRHDICYSCGAMHGWPRVDCDNGFYNDMIDLCKNSQSRRRRDIEDFIPMLRHKFKGSIPSDDFPGAPIHIWNYVCKFMANTYHLASSILEQAITTRCPLL